MPEPEHRVVCEITTIFEVTDPEIAARRPFCLALDQTRDPYDRLYMSTGRKVLVTAAVRAQLKEGDKVTLLRVGQPVVIEGQCGGLHGPNVALAGCILKSAP